MTFSDELDEKESLIEFNKQRTKTPSQFFNEDKTLRDIYSERAKRRQLATLKQNTESNNAVVLNLAQRSEDDENGRTRDKVAEAIGINRNTLETIREIGSLAETGTTATAKEPAKEEPKKPAVSSPVKLTVAPYSIFTLTNLSRGCR
jgi:hypothetical protein